MDSGIPDVAANHEAARLEPAEARQAGVNILVDDGGHAPLDFFWPMPIGLLVMGTAVSVFVGFCFLLR